MKEIEYGINLGLAVIALIAAFLLGLSLSTGLAIIAIALLLGAQHTNAQIREARRHKEVMAALKAIYQRGRNE